MKVIVALLMVTLMGMVPGTHALEQSASGSSNDVQSNGNALRAQLDAINEQNKNIQATIEAMSNKISAIAACSQQKKLWNGSGCTDLPKGTDTTVKGVNLTTSACGSLVITRKVNNGATSTKSQTACSGTNLSGNINGITNCPSKGLSSLTGITNNQQTQLDCGCLGQGCSSATCSQKVTLAATENYYAFTCMVTK